MQQASYNFNIYLCRIFYDTLNTYPTLFKDRYLLLYENVGTKYSKYWYSYLPISDCASNIFISGGVAYLLEFSDRPKA